MPLRRYVEFRDTMPEDLRYFWAAYKKGRFDLEEGLSPREFDAAFTDLALSFGRPWTMFAEGEIIGVVFSSVEGRVVTLLDAVWFGSKRNIFESMVNMLNSIRKDVSDPDERFNNPLRYYTALVYAPESQKGFFERICKRGILRRVGKLMDMKEGTVDLFQTRSPVA